MIRVHRQKVQFSLLVHFFQAQQVLFVESTLLQCLGCVNVAILVESKPLGFFWLNHRIPEKLDHNEVLQFHQVAFVVGVWWVTLLIDIGQKYAGAPILLQIGRIVPIFRLHQFVLDP